MIAKTKDSGRVGGKRKTAAVPRAHVISNSRGRTRIRVPHKRRDRAYFDKLKASLEKTPGVKRVEVNAFTGSGLIFHELGLDGLERIGHEGSLFEIVEEVLEQTPIGHKVVHGLEAANEELRTISDNRVDLAGVAFVGLLGAAVFQALRGNVLAPASTLLGDALSVLPRKGRWALTDEPDLQSGSRKSNA